MPTLQVDTVHLLRMLRKVSTSLRRYGREEDEDGQVLHQSKTEYTLLRKYRKWLSGLRPTETRPLILPYYIIGETLLFEINGL